VVRSSDKRTEASYLVEKYEVSKARTSRLLGLPITTLYYNPKENGDRPVASRLSELATEHKRFGHPRLFVLLKREISDLNHKRSRRIYQKLKLQIGRRKRKKLGSCPRLPATQAMGPNQIWAIDFMFDFIESGRRLKILTIVDEFAKLSPGVLVDQSIRGIDIVEYLDHLPEAPPPPERPPPNPPNPPPLRPPPPNPPPNPPPPRNQFEPPAFEAIKSISRPSGIRSAAESAP
jgi:putative transposase